MNDRYFFFREDYEILLETIKKLEDEYKQKGKESTEGSSVGDWHDNFAFEEATRQMTMLSNRIQEFKRILNNAEILPEKHKPSKISKVIIGCKVTLETEEGETKNYFIGSHTIFRKESQTEDFEIISYMSPLARAVMGKEVDDEAYLIIKGKKKLFTIIEIS